MKEEILYAIIYLIGYIVAYLSCREFVKLVFYEWTNGDRVICLFGALLSWALAIVTAACFAVVKIIDSDKSDKPAKW